MEGPKSVTNGMKTGDRLLRNDGNRFTDVSEEAGIYGGINGYGLGVFGGQISIRMAIRIFMLGTIFMKMIIFTLIMATVPSRKA